MIAVTFSALLVALSSSLPPAPVQGAPDPAFKDLVLAFAAKNDHSGVAKLMKSKKDDSVAWIVVTCESLAQKPNDADEKFAEALKAGWKEGIGGEFAEREYKAMKELGNNKRDRNGLMERLDAVLTDLEKNKEHPEDLVFQNAVDELDVVGPGLDETGDLYRSSQAYFVQAQCYENEVRGASVDLHKAWVAYGHVLETRDKLDLKDSVYEQATKRKAALLAKGADKKKDPNAEPPAGGGGEGGGAPPAGGANAGANPPPKEGANPGAAPAAGASPGAAGAPIVAAATFDALPAVDAFLRPNYSADEIFVLWNASMALKGKGSSTTFVRFTTGPPLIRVGKTDLRFDTNGDGQGDEKVPTPGTPVLVKVNIGKGTDARPWACLAQIGSDKDDFQGVQVNNNPSDESLFLFAISAASITANVGGVPIRIIDDDADSVYGNPPLSYPEYGCVNGENQPEFDSIVIGASKRARPWSELQQIGDKWYKLEPTTNAKEVHATPADVQTGTLKLEFTGPVQPAWIVVQGVDAALKNTRFDLVEGGAKGVAVPAGKYSFFYGEVRKGKRKQTQKVLILPGKSMPTWQVEPGKTAVVQLGGPFGFDWRHSVDGDKVKVEGASVCVVGAKGERYERAWGCVPRPEVSWRKKGTKTGSKGELMKVILDQDTMIKQKPDASWFPLDLEVPLKGEKNAIEVQLLEKKHDLFGKIESEWK